MSILRIFVVAGIVLILAVAAQGQITITAGDVQSQVGDVMEFDVVTVSDTSTAGLTYVGRIGVDVGQQGGPQIFDLSSPQYGELIPFTVNGKATTLRPEESPQAVDFPAATYVTRMQLGLPGGIPLLDASWFWQRTPVGDIPVGMTGGEFPPALPLPQTSMYPYPLSFGQEWDIEQQPFGLRLADGTPVGGVAALHATIDAWGTVVVPAGRFDALRVGMRGSATCPSPNGDLSVDLALYHWIAKTGGNGGAASIASARVQPAAGAPWTLTVTQLQRYLSVARPTSVPTLSWGKVKARLR